MVGVAVRYAVLSFVSGSMFCGCVREDKGGGVELNLRREGR